jgi:hypothetical protein
MTYPCLDTLDDGAGSNLKFPDSLVFLYASVTKYLRKSTSKEKRFSLAGCRCLMPIILVTWDAEIGRIKI